MMNRRTALKCVSCAAGALLLTEALHAETLSSCLAATPQSTLDVLEPGKVVVISGIYNVTHDKLDGDDHAHSSLRHSEERNRPASMPSVHGRR